MSSNSGRERLDHEVERAGDEHACGGRGARCSRTRRMAAGNDLARISCAEHLGRVLVELVDRGAVVAAVEEAQEVAAVLAVEGQQRRRLGQRAGHEAEPLVAAAGGGWRATSRTSTTFEAISVFSRSKAARWRSGDSTWPRRRVARGLGPAAAPGVVRTRACSTTDGRWIVADVVVPVDDAGVEAEARPGRRRRSASHSASRRSTP